MKKKLPVDPVKIVTPKGHQIRIIKPFCKSCEICVNFCPEDVLGLDKDLKVTAVNPEKCTACKWCEQHCPDLAIFVEKANKK
ncbi:MAG: 4Fe-4S binding protein [candidate division WOR-3 bacterium]|nr:4Fe-4S binding protein [candidate division WOR-3 bacterium]MDH5684203.1 4Fe-4S binding protein [candidate division WOR-3 bacterium]